MEISNIKLINEYYELKDKISREKLKKFQIFSNIRELKLGEELINGTIVKTLGFYQINDGGSGFYQIREKTANDTIDDIIIIELLDNTLVAEFINFNVNVKQFGAEGDGIHNDTLNIQKAIDYSIENKLKLYIPAGNYLIDNLEIYGGINVYGENKNKTKLISTNNENYSSLINISGGYTTLSNITIEGTSNGEYNANSHIQHGLSFGNSHENFAYRLNINNIEIKKFTGSGIYQYNYINGNLADSLFENLFISYNEEYGAYLFSNSDFSIINSYFAQNRFTGLYLNCSNCRLTNNKAYLNGVGIDNNNPSISQTRYHGFYIAGLGTIIDSCTSQENYGDGFFIENAQSSVLSNLTSDANGILGFTPNSFDLQHVGNTRIARSNSTITNQYAGFRFKNISRISANNLNVLSFIDTNIYGYQMAFCYYFEGSLNAIMNGYGTVENTSIYNTDFDFGNSIININEKLLGGYNKFIENNTNFTISNLNSGSTTGSFKINIPLWNSGLCIIKLQKANSLYDTIVISASRTENGVISSKVSNQENYSLTNNSDGVTINITEGGIYNASCITI